MAKGIKFKNSSEQVTDNVYSTSETVCGTWINGKPLYRKVINFGELPNTTEKNVSHGVSNIGTIVSMKGFAIRNTDGITIFLPYISVGDPDSNVGLYSKPGYVSAYALKDRRPYSVCYVTMEYTKTTD